MPLGLAGKGLALIHKNMMDTAGGGPATTLIMSWRCATNTDRDARAHTQLSNGKPHCSCDSTNVLGSLTVSLSDIHYLMISNSQTGNRKESAI